tara:strand:+ start:3 stop:1571 length:1569 start_codon:yes stop_codon:yes gene_type:complete
MDNILNEINKLYNKTSYNDIHGFDILISVILILLFLLATSYYHIRNNIDPIKADWINQKCKPGVIPFAGLINKPDGVSGSDYTNQNFTECIRDILRNVTDNAFTPFYQLMKILSEVFRIFNESIQMVRQLFNNLRLSMEAFVKDVMARAVNITIPLINIVIAAKSIIGKTIGTFATAIYTLLGGYLTAQSLALYVIKSINHILYVISGIVVALWAIAWFVFPAGIAAAAGTAIFTLILVPLILLKVFVDNVLEIQTDRPPKTPACFSGNTLLKLKDNTYKKISDINLNDVLIDGSIITAKMKASSHDQEIHELDNIIVTGNHNIFHSIKGWITAKEHPDSVLVNNFKDPFVYCINTNTKTIKINGNTFADWDDIDDDDISKLKNNFSLPTDFNPEDIHKYFDAGFHPNMKLKLENNNIVKIKDIKVNDILNNGERVCAIVSIDKKNMSKMYDFSIDAINVLTCTKNINILKNNMNSNNTSNLKGIEIHDDCLQLYHLVTDKKSFEINNVCVGDYNTSIEKFL